MNRAEVFIVKKVDAFIQPPLFYLTDTNNDPIQGTFYREQLTKAPDPYGPNHYHDIEKVLKTKRIKGKKFYYVKFLHYPDKFNAWVSEDDYVEGKKT